MSRRLRLHLCGAVQGVGFRPFVFRLAQEMNLKGWVINDARGVTIEAEGDHLELFASRVRTEKPEAAIIVEETVLWLEPAGFSDFVIRSSDETGAPQAAILPDLATCSECLREVRDPSNRRWGYPFTNCTRCGPRFTILKALPYDRPNTTMHRFAMCPACAAEYADPADRRFHAQPNACPVCGPSAALWDAKGRPIALGPDAVVQAGKALKQGAIVAVKGLGGFVLMTDARDAATVTRLRTRKKRPHRPLALMVRDLPLARQVCVISKNEEHLLTSPAAPIVLMRKLPGAPVAAEVAPGNPDLGLMLPSTPLHHLVLEDIDFPVVATSGNLSEEPICTAENEAYRRLQGIADFFLVHDRPIHRHCDDSVVRVMEGDLQILRRARGYAPLPVVVDEPIPPILAAGAHLKNTIALGTGRSVFISQHIGDLDNPQALAAFEQVIGDFLRLYDINPVAVAHDLHPDYTSTHWARTFSGARPLAVQHHHAHLAACLAENGARGPALGITWDGTGLGTDGTIWGGEFLLGSAEGCQRVASLRPFGLPGGDAAAEEPRRAALALLWGTYGAEGLGMEDLDPVRAFPEKERRIIARMLEQGINCPQTTSAGRLFDGVAGLAGLRQKISYEAQAAMELECAASPAETGVYPFPSVENPEQPGPTWTLDWRPLVEAVVTDRRRGVGVEVVAARFHNALVEGIAAVAHRVGEPTVVLSGGCFLNRKLTVRTAVRLREDGFRVLMHHQTPPGDGCISLGQVAVAAAQLKRE